MFLNAYMLRKRYYNESSSNKELGDSGHKPESNCDTYYRIPVTTEQVSSIQREPEAGAKHNLNFGRPDHPIGCNGSLGRPIGCNTQKGNYFPDS